MYERLFRYGNKHEPVDPITEMEKHFITRSDLNIPSTDEWYIINYITTVI